MNRLTKVNDYEALSNEPLFSQMIDKLRQYEDAEEAGRLHIDPDIKAGQKIYKLIPKCNQTGPQPSCQYQRIRDTGPNAFEQFCMSEGGYTQCDNLVIDERSYRPSCDMSEVGITVFTNKADAEKALLDKIN